MNNNELTVIGTWTPCFCGFYNTVFDPELAIDREIESLNDERKSNGLDSLTYGEYDRIGFDYKEYESEVARQFALHIMSELKSKGFVTDHSFDGVNSPKEYNFRNDEGHVSISLTRSNIAKILNYLRNNKEAFSERLIAKHTSRSGFISFQSNELSDWLNKDEFLDSYGLGFVLEFIYMNIEEFDSTYDVCTSLYYDIEASIGIKDYELATKGYYCRICKDFHPLDTLVANGLCEYSADIMSVNWLVSHNADYINDRQTVAEINDWNFEHHKSYFKLDGKYYGLSDTNYKYDMLAVAI